VIDDDDDEENVESPIKKTAMQSEVTSARDTTIKNIAGADDSSLKSFNNNKEPAVWEQNVKP
jgi:hypothetical protein